MRDVDIVTPSSVFCVTESLGTDGKKHRRWTRVGVALAYPDGTGIEIVLDALPLNGKLVVLPRHTDDEDASDSVSRIEA